MKSIISLFLLLMSFGASAQKMFTIEGYMKGVPDGTAVTLFKPSVLGDRKSSVLSKTVEGGRFTMHSAIPRDKERMELACGSARRWFPIWIAAGETVVVKGDGLDVLDWAVESAIPEQKEEDFFMQISRPFARLHSVIWEEYERLDSMRAALEDSLSVWEAGWGITNRGEYTDALIDSMNSSPKYLNTTFRKIALFDVAQAVISSFAPSNARLKLEKIRIMQEREVSLPWLMEYYWLLEWLPQLETNNSEVDHLPATFRGDVIALYDRIPAAMLDTDLGRETARYYAALTGKNEDLIDESKASGKVTVPLVEVGGPMSDTDFFDLDGNVRHLSEFLGGYILLDFWAHWCLPCVSAMPELREVAERYEGRLTAVSISKDAEQLWRIASDQHKITWHNFNADAAGDDLWRAYRVNGIPHYVLIGPDGNVVDLWTGYGPGSIRDRVSKIITDQP